MSASSPRSAFRVTSLFIKLVDSNSDSSIAGFFVVDLIEIDDHAAFQIRPLTKWHVQEAEGVIARGL